MGFGRWQEDGGSKASHGPRCYAMGGGAPSRSPVHSILGNKMESPAPGMRHRGRMTSDLFIEGPEVTKLSYHWPALGAMSMGCCEWVDAGWNDQQSLRSEHLVLPCLL